MASDDDQWGAGPKKDWRPFDEVAVVDGDVKFNLVHGAHPHGRQDNNLYAVRAGAKPSEAIAFSGHRFRTYLEIEEKNYVKSSSLTGTEIRQYAELRIHMDTEQGVRRLVYVKGAREVAFLMHWWLANHYRFSEDSPVQIFRASDVAKLPGMPLWFRGQPAVGKSWDPRRYLTITAVDPAGFRRSFGDEFGEEEPIMQWDGLEPWDVSSRKHRRLSNKGKGSH